MNSMVCRSEEGVAGEPPGSPAPDRSYDPIFSSECRWFPFGKSASWKDLGGSHHVVSLYCLALDSSKCKQHSWFHVEL